MPNIGDFQIIGLRTFGQVWKTDANETIVQTFAGPCQEDSATLTMDPSIADSNKLTPTTPPGGWGGTGYGDLVVWRPNNPADAAGAPFDWPENIPASTVLFLVHDESSTEYWLLVTIKDQRFVLALADEVTLATPAPTP